MIKIKWIKVGDVIEVDGKKAKLKSKVEDLTYTDLYTFKREDGSKFHWRHENIYRYVMDRHIRKLENLLSDEKQRADELEDRISEEIRKRFQLEDRWRKAYERADELEKRWSELKKTLLLYKDIPQSTQSFDTVFELMKEMEFKKEDDND